MDTLAHYLWAVILYGYLRTPRKWLRALSGAAPDLLSFGLFFLYATALGLSLPEGPPPEAAIPQFFIVAYNVTHSLVVIGTLTLLVWWLKPTWVSLAYGWILAVLMDIPTHTAAYFPTPFLWPISSLKFNGFRWSSEWFMIANYSAILVLFIHLYVSGRLRGNSLKSAPRR